MAITVSQAHTKNKPHIRLHRQQVLGIKIAGTGSYVPEKVVRNGDLSALGCDPEWIIQRTGISERRHAAPGQGTSDLAYEAAKRCLENADMTAADIDLIIMGTMTPDHATPNASCLLQEKLGATCGALDLSAACSGFMYSFITASQFVKTGCYQNILVVGGDIMSQLVDPNDKKTYPLFGDAAGAVIVSPSDSETGSTSGTTQGIRSFCLGANGSLGRHLVIPAGGSREPITVDAIQAGRHLLEMDGRPVFKWAVRKIGDSTREVLSRARLTVCDVDMMILHQANVRILDTASDYLGIPREKLFMNLQKYGNTSAGSIPLALDEANRSGLIHRGDKLLICGFGAGLTWGACVLEW